MILSPLLKITLTYFVRKVVHVLISAFLLYKDIVRIVREEQVWAFLQYSFAIIQSYHNAKAKSLIVALLSTFYRNICCCNRGLFSILSIRRAYIQLKRFKLTKIMNFSTGYNVYIILEISLNCSGEVHNKHI